MLPTVLTYSLRTLLSPCIFLLSYFRFLKVIPCSQSLRQKKKIEDIQDQMQFFLLPSNKKRERNSQIIQFSCSVVSDSFRPHGLQHARVPCPSPTPRACSNSCPNDSIVSDAIQPPLLTPFSSCLQSFPASGSFPMSQFFASGSQSIGVSASASVFSMNIQD